MPDPGYIVGGDIVAVGLDLKPETLLRAYSRGIFPWPSEGLPTFWYSPKRRAVLDFDRLHVPPRLRRFLKKQPWTYTVDTAFRSLQFVSASLYSLGHGGNDAQKTMGIVAVLLYSQGQLEGGFHVPFWVVITCQAAMGLGTLFGGWRIVHTMGSKITRLTPMQGFCAETGGAITLFLATHFGVPVSTTHTITGSIIGVGSAKRVSAVRWNVAKDIITAWIVTMPAAGGIAALTYWLVGLAGR